MKEYPPKNGVCSSCHDILNYGAWYRAEVKRLRGMKAKIKCYTYTDPFPCRGVKTVKGMKWLRELSEAGENLFRSLVIMEELYSYSADEREFLFKNSGNLYHVKNAILPEVIKEAWVDFVEVLKDVIQRIYDLGVKDGRSMLSGLASGEISVKDFNEGVND